MTRHAPNGFIMLEALIALVVVSFGILGFAGLQATGMSLNNSSLLRSKATVMAYEMADRMRANQLGVTGGSYDLMVTGAASQACASTAAGCPPATLALNDYYEWTTALAATLPGGKGVVCLDGVPGDGTYAIPLCDGAAGHFDIKIWWTEKGGTYRFSTSLVP